MAYHHAVICDLGSALPLIIGTLNGLAQSYSNSRARPSREAQCNARGARMTPKKMYEYIIFIDNVLTYSEWGARSSFSFHGGLAKND